MPSLNGEAIPPAVLLLSVGVAAKLLSASTTITVDSTDAKTNNHICTTNVIWHILLTLETARLSSVNSLLKLLILLIAVFGDLCCLSKPAHDAHWVTPWTVWRASPSKTGHWWQNTLRYGLIRCKVQTPLRLWLITIPSSKANRQ